MSLKSRFLEIFGPAWNDAEEIARDVALDAAIAAHFVEKEITMFSQDVQDLLGKGAAARAAIAAAQAASAKDIAAQAATITNLQSKLDAANQNASDQVKGLTDQVNSLTDQLAATAQARDDAVAQLTAVLNAEIDLAAAAQPTA